MKSKAAAATKPQASVVLKNYYKYEHLATDYAKQIFNSGKIGFEFDDLVQEFKIKIYTSIIAYAAKWKQYKKDGRYKPIALEYYIKSALVRRRIDFIVKISEEKPITLSIEQDGFDYSKLHSIESHIILNKKVAKAEINGVDLLEGLSDIESRCFMLYLRGFTIGKLQKVFKSKFEAGKVISKQIAFLQTKKHELLENQTTEFMTFKTEWENN